MISSQYEGMAAETSGLKASGFGVQMSAKMYSMMIDKLYKDKTGAVIRELSCNAWDSHREAGKVGTPFEIHMPTWLDKTFHIRDFGTGIPHENFEEIFTNIGASTKEGSNDDIGSYGLGSKSPFTVVDTFIVENWNGGTKTTWACFKSSGFPQVSRVSSEPSQEPSGLKVSFSFTADLTDSFNRSLLKQLKFFPVKPTLTGDPVVWPVIPNYSGKNYFYYEDTARGYSSSASVLMGNVNYPFTLEDLELSYISNLTQLFKKPLCIVAPIGGVDVPPSRESLEFTEKTKKYVIGVLGSIRAQYEAEFAGDLRKCTTRLEAMVHVRNSNLNMFDYRYDTVLLFNNGLSKATYRELNVADYRLTNCDVLDVSSYDGYLKTRFRVCPGIPVVKLGELKNNPKAYAVYVNDLGVGGVTHLKEQANVVRNASDKTYVIKHTTESKADKIKASCDLVIKALLDNHSITALPLSSLIGFPVRLTRVKGSSSSTGSRVKPDQVYLCSLSSGGNVSKMSSFKPEVAETTMPTSGYYVVIKGASYKTPDGADVSRERREIGIALDFALRYTKEKIYFVRETSVKRIPLTLRPFYTLQDTLKDKAILMKKMECRWQDINRELPHIDLCEAVVYLGRKDKKLQMLFRFLRMHMSKQMNTVYDPFKSKYAPADPTTDPKEKAKDAAMVKRVVVLKEHVDSKYRYLNTILSRGYGSYERDGALNELKALGL